MTNINNKYTIYKYVLYYKYTFSPIFISNFIYILNSFDMSIFFFFVPMRLKDIDDSLYVIT
jgi:hypothetical protein